MIKFKLQFESDEHIVRVYKWAETIGMKVQGGVRVTNPRTFESEQAWYVETEEDKTIFLLKWR